MRDRRFFSLAMFLLAGIGLLGMGLLSGCGDDDSPGQPAAKLTGTCEGCHQDAERLLATMDPDSGEPPGDTGEG